VPEAEVMERVDRSNVVSAVIALSGLALAIVCGVYVARQVARPLEALAREMAAIAELSLDPRPVVRSVVVEVERVAVATEDIKTGLRQKRVLEKYVPKGARADIERNHAGHIALGGARVRRAILFSDLRGFTSMSERLSPDAVVALLNAYLESMTAIILAYSGDINEYIGDAILAVFEDSSRAVAAATAMQDALVKLSRETDNEDLRALRMGIGIHAGEVVEGNIGTAERVKFGIVGDTVNLAARIQDRSRDGKHTCVLVSDVVRAETEAAFDLELVGDLAMKGKAAPVRVFEVVRRRPAAPVVSAAHPS
jgi:adenylate cyclase